MRQRNRQYPPSINPGIPRLDRYPVRWSRVPFGDLLEPVFRPVQMDPTATYQLIVAKRNRGGIAAREQLRGSEIKTKGQYWLREGDFVIAKRQIAHGACGFVPREFDGAIVSGEYDVFRVKPPLSPEFLDLFCHTNYFQQTCFHSSVGVSVEKLVFRTDRWLRFEMPLPSLAEQRAIVDVARCFDERVTTLETAITAKREFKRGLMQKLLTGQERFKEFDGSAWTTATIGDLFQEVERPVSWADDAQYRLVSVRRRSGGAFLREVKKGRDIKTKQLFTVRFRDIVISRMQVVHGAIGIVPAELDGAQVSGTYLVLVPRNEAVIDPKFFEYLTNLPRMYYAALLSSYGVHIEKMTLNPEWYFATPISVPSIIDEQRRIVDVLEACDRQIEGFEALHKATRRQQRAVISRLTVGEISALS